MSRIYDVELTTTWNTTVKYLPRGEIWTAHVIQRVVTLAVIMVITIVGNVIILVLLVCFSRHCKRYCRVNVFIIHLAVGDLSVCVCTMSTEILFVAFGDWVLGNVACKIITYAQIVTLAGTTFILTCMSFDRYLAICRPLRLGTTNSRARKMITASWLVAFFIAVPQLLIFQQTDVGVYSDGSVKQVCRTAYSAAWQRKVYFTFMTSYILIIPAILITFCYVNVAGVIWKQWRHCSSGSFISSGTIVTGPKTGTIGLKRSWPKAKIRTVLMTFSIIATFICCWTPYFVTTLIRVYSQDRHFIEKTIMVFAETLAVLPSALNPILYGLFNLKLVRSLAERCCQHSLSSPFRQHTQKRHSDECLAGQNAPPPLPRPNIEYMPIRPQNCELKCPVRAGQTNDIDPPV